MALADSEQGVENGPRPLVQERRRLRRSAVCAGSRFLARLNGADDIHLPEEEALQRFHQQAVDREHDEPVNLLAGHLRVDEELYGGEESIFHPSPKHGDGCFPVAGVVGVRIKLQTLPVSSGVAKRDVEILRHGDTSYLRAYREPARKSEKRNRYPLPCRLARNGQKETV